MTFDLPWGRLAAKTWGSSPPGVAGATVENAIEIHCELLLKDIDRSGQVPSSPRLAGQCWLMGQGDPHIPDICHFFSTYVICGSICLHTKVRKS